MTITQSGEMLFLLIEFTIIYLGLQLIEESLNMNKNNMLNHISIRAENLSKLVKEKNPISIKKVTRNIEFYDEDGNLRKGLRNKDGSSNAQFHHS